MCFVVGGWHLVDCSDLLRIRSDSFDIHKVSQASYSCLNKKHLLALNCNPYSAMRPNIFSRYLMWLSKYLLNTTMSSRYTRTDCHLRPARHRSIRRWKVAGALQRPKGITLNSNNPSGARKVVFSLSSSLIRIYQYPDARSKIE